MVEVFKTDVKDQEVADKLLDHIHKTFTAYTANFDLQDCDHILRVKSANGCIEPVCLIYYLKGLGYTAEILQDEIKLYTR